MTAGGYSFLIKNKIIDVAVQPVSHCNITNCCRVFSHVRASEESCGVVSNVSKIIPLFCGKIIWPMYISVAFKLIQIVN